MIKRRVLLAAAPLMVHQLAHSHGLGRMIVGTYDDRRLWSVKALTFPRVLVYNSDGELLPQESWPTKFSLLKAQAGDAFCCVSDKPPPPGHIGPPPDCKVVVYGEDINEHFVGLVDAAGAAIPRVSLPVHRHLVVEYYASWCAPCKPAREALQALLSSSNGRDVVALVVDFSRRVPGKRPSAA